MANEKSSSCYGSLFDFVDQHQGIEVEELYSQMKKVCGLPFGVVAGTLSHLLETGILKNETIEQTHPSRRLDLVSTGDWEG